MKPVTYHLTGNEAVYQGDDWQSPLFGLDDFTPLGGPAEPLSGDVEVEAQVKDQDGVLLGTFTVDIEDEGDMTFRLLMSSAETATLPVSVPELVVLTYDIQVVDPDTWGTRTVFRGRVQVLGQVTA